jgi:hypothetical protein
MIGHDPAGIAANVEISMAGELGEDMGPIGDGRGLLSSSFSASSNSDSFSKLSEDARRLSSAGSVSNEDDDDDDEGNNGGRRRNGAQMARSIVVRASEEILAGQPLHRLFPRCFSIGYTLFRFGFLPLRNRDLDRRQSAVDYDAMEQLPAAGVPDMFGTDGSEPPRRFLEQRLDGVPEAAPLTQIPSK